LEKFSGKGGWTFPRVPVKILPAKKAFGMIQVCGFIMGHEFEGKHLTSKGWVTFFFP